MIIPDKVREQVKFVAAYVDGCDDWVTVKKEVLRGIPSDLRRNFSTRNAKTKEQWLNDFEKELISYYKKLTGIELVLRTLSERKAMEM